MSRDDQAWEAKKAQHAYDAKCDEVERLRAEVRKQEGAVGVLQAAVARKGEALRECQDAVGRLRAESDVVREDLEYAHRENERLRDVEADAEDMRQSKDTWKHRFEEEKEAFAVEHAEAVRLSAQNDRWRKGFNWMLHTMHDQHARDFEHDYGDPTPIEECGEWECIRGLVVQAEAKDE